MLINYNLLKRLTIYQTYSHQNEQKYYLQSIFDNMNVKNMLITFLDINLISVVNQAKSKPKWFNLLS